MTATNGGTGKVYHEKGVPRPFKNKELGSRQKLYSELAYCRLMLQRKRSLGMKAHEEFYREEAHKLRRLIDSARGPAAPGGNGDLRRQIGVWVRLSGIGPLPTVEAESAYRPGVAGEVVPEPTDDERAEYDYLLGERAGLLMDSGLSEGQATAEAKNELGSFEFWQHARHVNGRLEGVPLNSIPLPARSLLLCSRCESRGHELEACPFGPTEDVLRIARQRRELRLKRVA